MNADSIQYALHSVWNMRRYCFDKAAALVRAPSAPISTEAVSIRHPLKFGRKARAALPPIDERRHGTSGCYGVSTTLPMLERPATISCASRASSRGRTLSISTFSFPSAAKIGATFAQVSEALRNLCGAIFWILGDIRPIARAGLWSPIFNIRVWCKRLGSKRGPVIQSRANWPVGARPSFRSSRANGLCLPDLAELPKIRATFQRDTLR